MVDVTIELSDEAVAAIMWAAARDEENPRSVEEYIAFVMSAAAESYAQQRDRADVETLGKEALEARRTGLVRLGK